MHLKGNKMKCYVLAFDDLLFVLDSHYMQSIRCLDLSTEEVHASYKILPKEKGNARYEFAVKVRNFVHLFDTRNQQQIRIDLYDMLPDSLNYRYSVQRKELIVSGWFRREQEMLDYFLPNPLKTIVFLFYPELA